MKTTVAPRAAIYTRFSSDERDSDSCAVQQGEARKAIVAHGWKPATDDPTFEDDGISGREMVRRPGFSRLLAAASSKAFDVIVVRDLDRFARGDVFRVGYVLQILHDHGVRVFEYLKGEFVNIDGENALLTAFKMYGNRNEAMKTSGRIKEKLRVADEGGTFTVAAPYGFKNARKHKHTGEIGVFPDRKSTVGVVVRHEEQFPVLLLIAELFLQFQTYNAVAVELNRRLIPDPIGRQNWQSQTVRAILLNPFYRGKIVRGRRKTVEVGGTIKRVPNEPDEIRYYDRPEFRVWDDETNKKLDAQIQARARNTTWSVGARKHLSSSFLRCQCGGSIVPSSSPRCPTYTCSKIKGHACTAGLGYRNEQVVDRALVEACIPILSNEVIDRTRAIIKEALDVRVQHDTRLVEHERLTRDIATAEKRVRSAEELVLDSEGPERDRYRASLREQLARLAAFRTQLQELDAQEPTPDPRALLADFDARVMGLRETLARGGLAALPVMQAILGGQRLTVTRTPEGRWELRGKGAVGALYRDREARWSQALSFLVH
jgi:DNA invertase Pin-like site-specific DNA recombinase